MEIYCIIVPKTGSREVWTYDSRDKFFDSLGKVFVNRPSSIDQARSFLLNKNNDVHVLEGLDNLKKWLRSEGRRFGVMLNDYVAN